MTIELGKTEELTKTEKKAIKNAEKGKQLEIEKAEQAEKNKKLTELLDSLPFVKYVKANKDVLRINVVGVDGNKIYIYCPVKKLESFGKFFTVEAGNAISVKESMKMVKSKITGKSEPQYYRTGNLISLETSFRTDSILKIEKLVSENKDEYPEIMDIINSFYPQ